MKTIGVLGGMGPRATVAFEELLLQSLPGTDQELPRIVTINDGSIPDRSEFLCGDGSDPVPLLQKNLDTLELIGADIIAMPCNTACAKSIFDRLHASSSELLNLPELVANSLEAETKALILATTGTIKSDSYQGLFSRRGIEFSVPSLYGQTLVDEIIRLVKSGRILEAKRRARRAKTQIVKSGCNTVILGCTELPLVQDALKLDGVEFVDTLDVLAKACVKKYNEGRIYEQRLIHTS